MKRKIAAIALLLAGGGSGSPFVGAFAPTSIAVAPRACRTSGTSCAPPRPGAAAAALRAALSPDTNHGGTHKAVNADQPSPLGAVLNMDANAAVDPLQTVLDNTASHTSRTQVINLVALVALTVATLSALLTVDLAPGIARGWTLEETAARIPLDDWARYNAALRTHPILTKAVTSGTVYALGDILAQTTEGHDLATLDRGRVTRSGVAGLLAHGPLSHYWYLGSEYVFDHVVHLSHEWWAVLPKILVDQTVWGPIWTCVYLGMIGVMQRDRWGAIGENIRKSLVPLTLSGLQLWPLAHIVTYGLIPVEDRLLWVDAVEIVWVTILATQAAALADQAEEASVHVVDGDQLAVETR